MPPTRRQGAVYLPPKTSPPFADIYVSALTNSTSTLRLFDKKTRLVSYKTLSSILTSPLSLKNIDNGIATKNKYGIIPISSSDFERLFFEFDQDLDGYLDFMEVVKMANTLNWERRVWDIWQRLCLKASEEARHDGPGYHPGKEWFGNKEVLGNFVAGVYRRCTEDSELEYQIRRAGYESSQELFSFQMAISVAHVLPPY